MINYSFNLLEETTFFLFPRPDQKPLINIMEEKIKCYLLGP